MPQKSVRKKTYDILNAGPKHRFMVDGRIVSNCSTGVQLQNLARAHLADIDLARSIVERGDLEALRFCYGNVSDTLGQLVRSALIPSPGCLFVDADFSAIEARVIAWLAGEEWVLDVFRTHGKIYEATASQMFGVPMEKIKKGNPEYELRQRGKVATLACGYQGGAHAMAAMDINHSIDPDLYPGLVKQWRKANPAIVKYWYDTEKAALDALKTGIPQTVGYCTYTLEIDELTNQWFLTCLLPSGRKLFYVRPTICENRFGKEAIRYWGINDKKKWAEIDTYGGRLVENCISGETLVPTNRGCIKLKYLSDKDFVWDGEDWVKHEGLLDKGIQPCIAVNGVNMTADHKILTDGGWVDASSCEGLNGPDIGLPDRSRILFDHSVPCVSQVAGTFAVQKSRCSEQRVYDLLNCGPRNRFCVIGDNGIMVVHNCCQAVARDCLADKLPKLAAAGYHTPFTIHDEAVADVPKDRADLDTMASIMAAPIEWAPGLPLNADGWVGEYFKKD